MQPLMLMYSANVERFMVRVNLNSIWRCTHHQDIFNQIFCVWVSDEKSCKVGVIKLLTISYGNLDVYTETRNACHLLDIFNKDIPLVAVFRL